MFPLLSYFIQCCVFVYSSLVSFQISHALPLCVLRLVDCLPILIIVTCPVMIVFTCFSSPSVFSLCFPVSRCQFVFVSPVSQEFQRFPMISTVLTITTLA